MDKKRILIVDDEESFTRMVKLNLEKTGSFEVREENKATYALAAAREFKPDLILLDVIMPTMDGGDVAAHFENDRHLKNIPVVFLTATVSRREAGPAGLNSGGSLFLAKPVSLENLIKCINENVRKTPPSPASGVHIPSPQKPG
ncbi:MAG: response regulator [Verrucomicrobia bacterium]|nr:response regulator [Verrucomicrobiota bacterium]